MLTISEISTKDGFYNLKDNWNKLLSKSESNNIFLTWEWLFNWWEVFKDNKKLKILLVKEGGKIIGIAPLYVSTDDNNSEQIKFIGSLHVGSDYLDFISQRGSEHEVISMIFSYLDSDKLKWQIINLIDISARSRSVELIQSLHNNKYYVATKKHDTCPYVSLPKSYELFLESLSSSMRYNIRRKRKRFEKEFNGNFVVIEDKNELVKSIEELIALNLSRTKAMNIYSPFSDKRFSQFHFNFINTVFDKGWVKVCFLKVENSSIGCLYIMNYARKHYFYQSGFDPVWKKLSPGFLLFSYCIENAISEGAVEFDFLKGEEAYKYKWTNEKKTNYEMNIYRKNLKNKLLYIRDKLTIIGKSKIKELLFNN